MANARKSSDGKVAFRPRARLVSVLGEQLIRDATIGLLELVKNSYDADAANVEVELLNLTIDDEEASRILKEHNVPKSEEKAFIEAYRLKRTTIIVQDDGYGMDLTTIINQWLEPATGHKEASKQQKMRTPKGRLPLGEKGVGRFAAHKLGRHLTLISRATDEKGKLADEEVVLTINWDRFDDPLAYLSDITVEYQERNPRHFTDRSGTFMEMKHARDLWKKQNVERVSGALRRLMSPFKTPEDFSVTLKCPDYPQYEDLGHSELLETAHAQMTILVDENGVADYEYTFSLEPYQRNVIEKTSVDLRQRIENWEPPDRKSECGQFSVTLYIWDRAANSIKLSGTNIKDLNQVNGISVFRDGIRVMPYGEPDDDWLDIDEARYMRTSGAFSRKNVVGAIEINQINNSRLRDKSNREGFIENEAFSDLRDLMQAVMNIAFNEFAEDRTKIREAEKVAKREVLPAVTQLETSINSVVQSLENTRNIAQEFVEKGKISPDVAGQMLEIFNQTSKTLETAATETREAAVDALTTFDDERDMLLELSGLGLAAERFTHEFARMTREASEILFKLRLRVRARRFDEAIDFIETLKVTLDALRDLVLTLAPMFYVRRRTREKSLDIKTIVEHALLLNEGDIRYYKIQVKIDEQEKMTVVMREGSLTQVFNNLIDNACYWLGRIPQKNDRHLRITILAEERAVIVADNGPGVNPEDRHRIFNPFFSTKTDGRGLGLYITREILAEANAIIELLDTGEHSARFKTGTAFRVQFPGGSNR